MCLVSGTAGAAQAAKSCPASRPALGRRPWIQPQMGQELLDHRQLEESIGLAVSPEHRGLRAEIGEELIREMGRPAYVQAQQKGRSDSLENAYRIIFSGSLT